MEIKILGTGCASCKALYETVKSVVEEAHLDANVVKEEDIVNIMAYNVLKLPALVIDEKVVSSGKKLSASEIKSLLNL